MKRIKSGITCPLCKKDTIKLCRDSITVFNIKKLKTGKLKLGTESKEESQTLDNCWIECGNCHSTNDMIIMQNYKKYMICYFNKEYL
jgi:hypothetical protein